MTEEEQLQDIAITFNQLKNILSDAGLDLDKTLVIEVIEEMIIAKKKALIRDRLTICKIPKLISMKAILEKERSELVHKQLQEQFGEP